MEFGPEWPKPKKMLKGGVRHRIELLSETAFETTPPETPEFRTTCVLQVLWKVDALFDYADLI